MNRYYLLPDKFEIEGDIGKKLCEDYERFGDSGLPENLEEYILDTYKMDISSKYGEKRIKNPFGMASGQVTTSLKQIGDGIDQGIGFIVLKTVISEDSMGNATMDAWKVEAPRMVVEEIISKGGEKGYTVTWKGRGWSKSFEEYLRFMEDSLRLGNEREVPVIPSCKFNLPSSKEEPFKEGEYEYTVHKLFNVWKNVFGNTQMYLEKDFSPTLAGSDLSREKENIVWWLKKVPELIKKYGAKEEIYLGLKLMNAAFEDSFQVEMLKTILGDEETSVDYLICFNRLFDRDKVFEDKKGVAYGGFDLSHRNLKVLSILRTLQQRGELKLKDLPISATGNIQSGRMLLEYALRGCQNGQIHTYFQIPAFNYRMKRGGRVAKALHELIFNPSQGLLAGIYHLMKQDMLQSRGGILYFEDIVNLYKRKDIFKDWDGDRE